MILSTLIRLPMNQFIAILFEAVRCGFRAQSDFYKTRVSPSRATLRIRRRLLRNIMVHHYECRSQKQKNAQG